jgi:hypothetical protein
VDVCSFARLDDRFFGDFFEPAQAEENVLADGALV